MFGRTLTRPGACALALLLAPAGAAADAPPRQAFIERTLVIAPHRVGEFVLQGSHYDPAHRFAGVSLRYGLPGNDETRIDLFVYPVGQGETEATLDRGMRDFRATLDAAQQAGYYRGLAVAGAVEFDIPLAPAAETGSGVPAEAPAREDASDPDQRHGHDHDHDHDSDADAGVDANVDGDAGDDEHAALLAALLDTGRHVDGRMLELSYDYPGQAQDEWLPMHSRGYLFYRHLNFFKGRVSAAQSRIDRTAFAALADRAMHALVPAVQAYNIGSCGDSAIHVDTSLPEREMGQMLMRQLVDAQARSVASNCRTRADEAELAALSGGAEVLVIEYAADDWRGE